MRTDPSVTNLVVNAKNGDEQAWAELVKRYACLVWSLCRTCELVPADAEEVGQGFWLRRAGQLDKLRGSAALAGWLAARQWPWSRTCHETGTPS